MEKENFLDNILIGLNELPKGKYVAFDDNYLNGNENGQSIETNKIIDLFSELNKWRKENPDTIIYFDILENENLTIDEGLSLEVLHPKKLEAKDFKIITSKEELNEMLTKELNISLDDIIDLFDDNSSNFPAA